MHQGSRCIKAKGSDDDGDGDGRAGGCIFAVEVILGKWAGRERAQSRVECLIKWVGFPSADNTWEPECNISTASIDQCERGVGQQQQKAPAQKGEGAKEAPKQQAEGAARPQVQEEVREEPTQ